MRSKIGTALVAGVALSAMIGQTAAGGYAASCYEKVHQPPVYKTVYEKVLVSPGARYVEYLPPIYGTKRRHVLIASAQTVKRVIPAVYKTVHRKVMVHEGGYTWEWQWIKGRKVLCKVKRPAVYKTVAETVVVQEARVVHETIPARYGYVTERVLISPGEKRVRHSAPVYETVARQVLVSAGQSSWRPVRIRGHCG